MNMADVAIGGIPLCPLIIALVQFIKQFDVEEEVPSRYWLLIAMLMGFVGWLAYTFTVSGLPVYFAGWIGLVAMGISYGLATAKIYDETLRVIL